MTATPQPTGPPEPGTVSHEPRSVESEPTAQSLTPILLVGGLGLLAALAVGLFVALSVRGDDPQGAVETTQAQSSEELVDKEPTPAAIADSCPPVDGSAPRRTTFDAPFPMCIDPATEYVAIVTTNQGKFTIELDASKAPLTVNNFVSLARSHFYDGVTFHRKIPDFVIQGGDAEGVPLGTGGPGYLFADELPAAGEYQLGSVAMANAGADTNGSQFFIVTGDDGIALDPNYSLFGQVIEGMDTIEAIDATGQDDGQSTEETVIVSILIVN